MNRPPIWPWLKPFLVLVMVVAIPPLTYWFVYVKHTVDAAKQQAHTTLAAVATNFKDRLIAHDQIATTAENSARADSDSVSGITATREYLQSVLQPRELVVIPTEQSHLDMDRKSGGLYINVGRFAKDSAGCNAEKGCSLRAVVALENLISWQIVQPEFDGLLVLSDTGTLLAQDRRLPTQALGIPMSILEGGAPLDYQKLLTDPKYVSAALQQEPRLSPLDFKADRSMQLSGVEYLVFVQPVTVSSSPTIGGSAVESATFLVCGLLRKERLRSEAIKLSPQTLTLTGALVALGLFAIPFLKLRFIGARERMRRRDIWLLCASLLCVTALGVLVMLDRHTRDKLHERFDIGLRQFTVAITNNVTRESEMAVQQLEQSAKAILSSAAANSDNCSDRTAIGSALADRNIASQGAFAYPNFEAIYVTDRCGNQRHKWMPRTTPTPNVPSGSLPFYAATISLANQRYAFSSLIARTSGLQLGVFTQPLDKANRKIGVEIPFAERAGVVALATSLHSVNAPVVPRPFQFVIVNRQGEVTFQQAQGPFRGERFLEAVDNGLALERIAADNARLGIDRRTQETQIVARNYRGRIYRMNAIELPELQQTLIAYYDEDTVDSLAARIFGTAALFAVAIIVCILIGAAIAACWFGEHAHDWLWPTSSYAPLYFVGAVLCLLSMLVPVLVRNWVSSNAMAIFLLFAPIIIMIGLGSGYVAKWLERIISTTAFSQLRSAHVWRTSRAYQTFAVCGLLAFVAWPTALAVDDAFTLHTASFTHSVARDLEISKDKFRSATAANVINVGSALAPMNCKTSPTDQRCVIAERTYATQTNFDNLIATRNRLAMYGTCANLQNSDITFASGQCALNVAPWSFTAGIANQAARFSRKVDLAFVIAGFAAAQSHSDLEPLSLMAGFAWSQWIIVGVLLLVCGISLLVGSVAKHVLGINLTNRLAIDESRDFQPGPKTQWLLLRPTSNAFFQSCQRANVLYDLRDATLTPNFTAPASGVTILLHHIEARIAHAEWRAAILLLLRTPAEGCVVLCSEIDPSHFLLNLIGEAEESFRELEVGDPKRAAVEKLCSDLQMELSDWSNALRRVRKIRDLVETFAFPADNSNAARLMIECACTDPLIEIGRRLSQTPNLETYRWEEVVGFVLDAAEPYYRATWDLCSREEKLVLIQLAQEGLVNPKRIEIVQRLARRSLVSVDPRFKLMNDSFKRFVCSIETPERIADWERAPAGSSWSRLGAPLYALAAVVIAILLFTEQEMFSSFIAVATGAVGTLSSVRNLYASAIKPVAALAKNV